MTHDPPDKGFTVAPEYYSTGPRRYCVVGPDGDMHSGGYLTRAEAEAEASRLNSDDPSVSLLLPDPAADLLRARVDVVRAQARLAAATAERNAAAYAVYDAERTFDIALADYDKSVTS